MKKLIALVVTIFLLALTPPYHDERELTVKCTLQEWQVLVGIINSPDDFSQNQKKAILQRIVPQINMQLAATDSVKNKH